MSEVSEEEIGSPIIPKRGNHDKGKKVWVPKPKFLDRRKGFGELLIRENQDQKEKKEESDIMTSWHHWHHEFIFRPTDSEVAN